MALDTVISVNAPDAEPSSPDVVQRDQPPLPRRLPRWVAACEVLLVSGVPTQIMIAGALVMFAGFQSPLAGPVSLPFMAAVALTDTLLIVVLVVTFLKLTGEDPKRIFLGSVPVWRDALRGLLLVPVVVLAVAGLVLGIRFIAPWTQTVDVNPLTAYLGSPGEAAILLIVAIFAGGVREELQRAFVLHRFGQYLGGMRLGLVLFTLMFGALHFEQGVDVAIAVGTLGFWWGLVYMRKRSAIFPMANHAGFNAVQVLQAFLVRAAG